MTGQGQEPENNRRRSFDPQALIGRRVLVTGASSGLGRAAAIALAWSGAQVILQGRDQPRLKATLAMMSGGNHVCIPSSLTDADQVSQLVKEIASTQGALDGVFHAAGVYLAMPAKATRQKHIDQVFAASLWGAFGIARAVSSRSVMNEGGSVVFISSVASQRGHPGTLAYAAAKAAVHGIVPVLALELAPKGIRVNVITSGTVETEMHLTTAAGIRQELVDEGARRHMFGFGAPVDIAEAVVFLMTDASRWITGSAMNVDGGYLAK